MTTRTYEYQSDFVRRYILEGRAEGEATGGRRALLTVLEARGFELPRDARERIARCADVDLLEQWTRRAATITTVDDLF